MLFQTVASQQPAVLPVPILDKPVARERRLSRHDRQDEVPENLSVPRAQATSGSRSASFAPLFFTDIFFFFSQRIRQTWNKYNLFNLHQNLRMPRLIQKTFFQQKWDAKALTRGYHGEHIKERQWERMFSRRLASVVDMNPRYMAEFDGSEQAEGRGSGKQRDPAAGSPPMQPWAGTNLRTAQPTPFMQMAFAPLERRLDIAIFRSLFASSARQARQFVVHGAVKVNGKKVCPLLVFGIPLLTNR